MSDQEVKVPSPKPVVTISGPAAMKYSKRTEAESGIQYVIKVLKLILIDWKKDPDSAERRNDDVLKAALSKYSKAHTDVFASYPVIVTMLIQDRIIDGKLVEAYLQKVYEDTETYPVIVGDKIKHNWNLEDDKIKSQSEYYKEYLKKYVKPPMSEKELETARQHIFKQHLDQYGKMLEMYKASQKETKAAEDRIKEDMAATLRRALERMDK